MSQPCGIRSIQKIESRILFDANGVERIGTLIFSKWYNESWIWKFHQNKMNRYLERFGYGSMNVTSHIRIIRCKWIKKSNVSKSLEWIKRIDVYHNYKMKLSLWVESSSEFHKWLVIAYDFRYCKGIEMLNVSNRIQWFRDINGFGCHKRIYDLKDQKK